VDGWRLNQGSHHRFVFSENGRRHEVTLEFRADGYGLRTGEATHALSGERLGEGTLRLQLEGRTFTARTVRVGREWHVFAGGAGYALVLEEDLPLLEDERAPGGLAAPMPGKVIAVHVKAGEKVARGAPLLILEAMKMEHTIHAPAAGLVKAIHFAPGEQVPEGAELITLEADK
jgi:3-methylcrotonyl-CoA carboxylase alpha subunit